MIGTKGNVSAEEAQRLIGRPYRVLEFDGVTFEYRSGEPVLKDVSLELGPGELVMVLGRSGSGKTTLLKLAKGFLRPTAGRVLVGGERSMEPSSRHRPDVAYIPQHLGLVRGSSVLTNVLLGCLARVGGLASLFGRFPKEEVTKAYGLMEELGIAQKAHERVWVLSGGERQRVAIARALMQEPRLILADEFVSQLDALTANAIMQITRAITARGVTVLMATHDFDLVGAYADRVLVLRHGSLVAEASPSEALPERLEEWIRG